MLTDPSGAQIPKFIWLLFVPLRLMCIHGEFDANNLFCRHSVPHANAQQLHN